MLKFVIPKGSLEERTLELLEAADIRLIRGSDRDYHGTCEDPRIDRFSILRPQEIPKYVEDGFFDLGITSLDWVEETGAKVEVVSELVAEAGRQGGSVRLVLAVSQSSGVTDPKQIQPDSRISTEYPNLTDQFFKKLGVPVKIFLSYGATEAKVPEIVDAIVEATETGTSLRHQGLVEIATILEFGTLLIANTAAFAEEAKRKAMEEIKILILGAINARGKVLVKLNVEEEKLDGVISVLPSMKAPTVSKLSKDPFYAVETVVEKNQINLLIPILKEKGATDIIELPLTKIVD